MKNNKYLPSSPLLTSTNTDSGEFRKSGLGLALLPCTSASISNGRRSGFILFNCKHKSVMNLHRKANFQSKHGRKANRKCTLKAIQFTKFQVKFLYVDKTAQLAQTYRKNNMVAVSWLFRYYSSRYL